MYNIGLLLFLTTVTCHTRQDRPIVETPLGTIEGIEKQTESGRTFFSFEGVPYAEPPVGKLRFKDPVPLEPFTGTWKADTVFTCMQYNPLTPDGEDLVIGDEDCLYLNIYTPQPFPVKKLDVLVYIHGGAFMFNYGARYGPKFIMDRDIVYVSLNYRLGPLGFLSTEDNVVPGNMGLKDQQLALQWVKDNIEYFGGDANSITISGMSAGGASVEFHYLLPKSQGLFHRGISMSGSVLNSWVLLENALEKTQKLAGIVGCPDIDTEQMTECLRNKPGRQLTQAVKHFQPWLYNPYSPWAPVVDSWASEPFVPDHPYNLLKNKKVLDVPWLISYVSSEGLYPGSDFYRHERAEYLDQNWNAVLPYILHYNEVVEPKLMDDLSQRIRREYLGDEKVSRKTFSKMIKALSDRLFIADIGKAGRLHSAAVNSPVYSYYFDYRGAHSISELISGSNDNIGVSHADDTCYVLNIGNPGFTTTENDKQMSKLMIDMFVSFMQTGKPNITTNWIPLSKKVTDPWVQLTIRGPNELILEQVHDLGNAKFWDSLPFQENEKLFNTKDEL